LVRLLTFTSGFNTKKGWAVTVGIDTKKLAITMAPIAAAVDHAPVPAYYTFVDAGNGQQTTAIPHTDSPGLAIDIEKAAQAILASPSTGHNAVIPYKYPRAGFTLADAQALNFDTLMGRGAADTAGSSKTRQANARAAAAPLSSVRLQPGQTLSITTAITPVVRANGFSPEVGGFGMRYDITGTNGGPNLVASALFQAAYNAGLTITRRASYPNVTDINGIPGTDAIVRARPAGADLRIANNTAHTVLVGAVLNRGQVSAYVFSSRAEQRATSVVGPVVTLNQDGSIDAQIGRSVSGDLTQQDQVRTHYNSVDQYP
jgi:vancomycin resistance protein YoaR